MADTVRVSPCGDRHDPGACQGAGKGGDLEASAGLRLRSGAGFLGGSPQHLEESVEAPVSLEHDVLDLLQGDVHVEEVLRDLVHVSAEFVPRARTEQGQWYH